MDTFLSFLMIWELKINNINALDSRGKDILFPFLCLLAINQIKFPSRREVVKATIPQNILFISHTRKIYKFAKK